MKIALIAVLVALFALGGCFVSKRNEIVAQNEAIKFAWSQVDNALQRRADLIPNLVSTVKGFAKQEQTVFSDLANARAAMAGARTPAERIQANSAIDSALGRLLVVVENYPQLKSNENFLRLQDELSGTENRIAVERQKYNKSIQDYNTNIQQFPANLVASVSGYQVNNDYLKTEPAARQVPKVNF